MGSTDYAMTEDGITFSAELGAETAAEAILLACANLLTDFLCVPQFEIVWLCHNLLITIDLLISCTAHSPKFKFKLKQLLVAKYPSCSRFVNLQEGLNHHLHESRFLQGISLLRSIA